MTPLNVRVLRLFAPVLLLVAVLGFVLPPSLALTSGAVPYDVFHLGFGVLGLGLAFTGRLPLARAFNVGFGLIDLYQALASFAGWWPQPLFQWKPADDVLHVLLGAGLVAVGLFADRPAR